MQKTRSSNLKFNSPFYNLQTLAKEVKNRMSSKENISRNIHFLQADFHLRAEVWVPQPQCSAGTGQGKWLFFSSLNVSCYKQLLGIIDVLKAFGEMDLRGDPVGFPRATLDRFSK